MFSVYAQVNCELYFVGLQKDYERPQDYMVMNLLNFLVSIDVLYPHELSSFGYPKEVGGITFVLMNTDEVYKVEDCDKLGGFYYDRHEISNLIEKNTYGPRDRYGDLQWTP
jgi:hypothetical protein